MYYYFIPKIRTQILRDNAFRDYINHNDEYDLLILVNAPNQYYYGVLAAISDFVILKTSIGEYKILNNTFFDCNNTYSTLRDIQDDLNLRQINFRIL